MIPTKSFDVHTYSLRLLPVMGMHTHNPWASFHVPITVCDCVQLCVTACSCENDTVCSSGSCDCPLLCDGTCVDMMSDNDNCGACGNGYGNELLPMMCIHTTSFVKLVEKWAKRNAFACPGSLPRIPANRATSELENVA
jgi:hypothetical protein